MDPLKPIKDAVVGALFDEDEHDKRHVFELMWASLTLSNKLLVLDDPKVITYLAAKQVSVNDLFCALHDWMENAESRCVQAKAVLYADPYTLSWYFPLDAIKRPLTSFERELIDDGWTHIQSTAHDPITLLHSALVFVNEALMEPGDTAFKISKEPSFECGRKSVKDKITSCISRWSKNNMP